MGLRQPSKTAVFFKQAAAGAQQQKEARETLKKPQALGGAAAAGTQMVAATTGAQQQATQQVQQAGQEVQEKTKVSQLPGATASSMVPTSVKPETVGTALNNVQWWQHQGPNSNITYQASIAAAAQKDVPEIKAAIAKLDQDLQSATAADQKALLDKKTELEKTLLDYENKLSKENLGQIAGPSTFETEMGQREKILATEGQNVGKLRALFGPRFDASKYGALASQIYGKDLEAIQEAATTGLEEKQRAEEATESALGQYKEGITQRKKDVAETAKTQSDRIRGLQIGAAGLMSEGYTEADIRKLYGADFDKYFEIQGGKVIDKFAKTKQALAERQAARETIAKTAEESKKQAEEQTFKNIQSQLVKKDEYGRVKGGQLIDAKNAIRPPGDRMQTIGKLSRDEAKNAANVYSSAKNAYQEKLVSIENMINNAQNYQQIRDAQALLFKAQGEYRQALTNAKIKTWF